MSIFGKPGGAADGANKLFQLRQDSTPSAIVDYVVWPGQAAQPAGVFRLTGARSGDALTVIIEDRPYSDSFVEPLIVIPAAFKSGVITVVNQTFGGFFILTEDSLGAPAYENFQLDLGVERIGPGFAQLTVLDTPTATGDRIVQLAALSQVLKTAYNLSWLNQHDTPYDTPVLHEVITNNQGGALYLPSTPPYAVRVYSDAPVYMRMVVSTWDAQAKGWAVGGEYVWKTQDDGSPDYTTLITLTALPGVAVPGAGSFTLLPNDSRVEIYRQPPVEPDAPQNLVFDGSFAVLGAFTQA